MDITPRCTSEGASGEAENRIRRMPELRACCSSAEKKGLGRYRESSCGRNSIKLSVVVGYFKHNCGSKKKTRQREKEESLDVVLVGLAK
jgi:hypothetical protein